MKLLACLLNCRTADMALEALALLVSEIRAVPGSRVVVVDNDSQDGSFEKLTLAVGAAGWNNVVDVVASGHNGGFGYGNNIVLRRGLESDDKPEYFFLLNSDAFLVPGALQALVDYLDVNPKVGIAGSATQSRDGSPQNSCFRFPSVMSELADAAHLHALNTLLKKQTVVMEPPDQTRTVDWVAGAAMMIRREVIEKIGLFDEMFFLYYEETDLCLRANRAGWESAYVRNSKVAHIGGASTGVQSHAVSTNRMPEYVFASRRHYFLKNHGRLRLWAANTARFLAGASFRVRRAAQMKPDPERPREWVDGVQYNLRHP